MSQSIAFVKQLMEAFLTGFAIATVVHLLIFPRSSRDVVFQQLSGYCAALEKAIKAQQKYFESMEHGDMLGHAVTGKGQQLSNVEQASKDLKAALAALGAAHARVHADLPFAKREIAFGNLDAKNTKKLFDHLRQVFLPTLGLGSIADIFERLAEKRGWDNKDGDTRNSETSSDNDCKARQEEISEWNEIMQTLHQPFTSVSQAMIDGIDHATYVLRLAKKPKASKDTSKEDVEAAAANPPKPGDPKCSEHLCAVHKEFWESRAAVLRVWCAQKGVSFPEDPNGETGANENDLKIMRITTMETGRQQLYLIFYMEYLLQSASQGVLDLVKFADELVADGTMSRRRLLLPGKRRLKKWLRSALSVEDSSTDHAPDSAEAQLYSVTLGDAFQKQKDPEHLPPTNAFQRFGNGVRGVSRTLRSNEVAFGFRVACATMSIAIVAFLEQTQTFFIAQRLVWAMIMVGSSIICVFLFTC